MCSDFVALLLNLKDTLSGELVLIVLFSQSPT